MATPGIILRVKYGDQPESYSGEPQPRWKGQRHPGWCEVRLPQTHQALWVLAAHAAERQHDLILLTNIPLPDAQTVRQVHGDWRQRSLIEHGYRFDQEEGLDVEDMRMETLERMRRLFILVLMAAQFVCAIGRTWPQPAVLRLRQRGSRSPIGDLALNYYTM